MAPLASLGGVYTTSLSPNPFTIQVSIPIPSARIWSVYTKLFLQHSNTHNEGTLLQTCDTQVELRWIQNYPTRNGFSLAYSVIQYLCAALSRRLRHLLQTNLREELIRKFWHISCICLEYARSAKSTRKTLIS